MLVERSVRLEAGVDEAWERVLDLSSWIGAIEGPLTEGAVVKVALEEGDREAVVGRIDPGRSVSWVWSDAHGPSRVDVTVEPCGSGSIVRVRETALLGGRHTSGRLEARRRWAKPMALLGRDRVLAAAGTWL